MHVAAANGLARRLRRLTCALPLLLCAAIFASSPPARAQGPADLDALIKAARADGELTFYSGATEIIAGLLPPESVVVHGVGVLRSVLQSNNLGAGCGCCNK